MFSPIKAPRQNILTFTYYGDNISLSVKTNMKQQRNTTSKMPQSQPSGDRTRVKDPHILVPSRVPPHKMTLCITPGIQEKFKTDSNSYLQNNDPSIFKAYYLRKRSLDKSILLVLWSYIHRHLSSTTQI